MMGEMHIYGQTDWHSDAFIVGDDKALKELRDTINRVLETGNPVRFEPMVKDGEGYWLYVVRLPLFYGDVDKEGVKCHTMENMAVPYTSEIATDNDENAVWPETIVGREMHIVEDSELMNKLPVMLNPEVVKKWSPEKIDAFIKLIEKS
jgi:hypothetical protein